jgi:hypothetical protein
MFIGQIGHIDGRRQPENAGRGSNHRDAVTTLISRGHGALQALFDSFDAIGVERDVLRRRSEGNRQRKPDHAVQRFSRISTGHAHQ